MTVLNRLIDSSGFTIVIINDIPTLFTSSAYDSSIEQAKRFIVEFGLKLSNFECSYTHLMSPALLAKYGFACGSPEPEQPAEQPAKQKPCKICRKTSFKTAKNCANPLTISNGWQCQLNTSFVGTARVSRSDFIIQYRGGKL